MKNKPEYYGYVVEKDSYCEVTIHADPDDKWSADSTDTSWFLSNIIKSNETDPDFVSPVKAVEGVTYYVPYAIHGTGDSFSNHGGHYCTFFDMFESKKEAHDLLELVTTTSGYSFEYKDSADQVRTISTDWNGYFESLDETGVLEVTL
jgi:hypothetical protein